MEIYLLGAIGGGILGVFTYFYKNITIAKTLANSNKEAIRNNALAIADLGQSFKHDLRQGLDEAHKSSRRRHSELKDDIAELSKNLALEGVAREEERRALEGQNRSHATNLASLGVELGKLQGTLNTLTLLFGELKN